MKLYYSLKDEDTHPPRIHIHHWPSFEAWRDAGYPGAPSFANPKTERQPDPRAGLCTYPGCDHVAYGGRSSLRLGLCGRHYDLFKKDHTPTVRAWPVENAAVRIAREKAR